MSSPGPSPRFRSASLSSSNLPTIPLPQSQKKESYAPCISSPLREERLSDDRLDGFQRRKSLQVTVVTVGPEVGAQTDSDSESRKASVGSTRSPTSLIRESPAISLQSVGRDFSRYPMQDFSSGTPSSSGNSIPLATLHTGEPIEVGYNLEKDDPEQGLAPYVKQRGKPVIYPTLHEKEDDDDLHNPAFDEKVPQSLRVMCKQPRFLVMALCYILCIGGLLVMFIGWPILTYARGGRGKYHHPKEELSKYDYGVLKAIRPLIDPDTPSYAMKRKSVLGQGDLKLVFSDEFNVDGRTFYENEDQFWQAADLHYAATNDLEWYDPGQVTTANGTLQLQLKTLRNHDLNYRSGMLQSWNKICFKGGVMEVSASLAGPGGTPGLWPGIWSLGNLARPGYQATTDGVWPYSYNQCDVGITPNQSSSDGISYLPGQRLGKCTCPGEDHPNRGVGRGAPEIDALEGTADYGMRLGTITQSSQVAPFDVWYQTDPRFIGLTGDFTQMNSWVGGPFQQAISGVTTLNNSWYDGIAFQKYAFEYIPGKEDGMIAWFVGDDETFRISGKAIGPNGNIGQRDVAEEPLSMVLNLGISTAWVWIDWDTLRPRLAEGTTMHIDYVRIYQKEGQEMITCDPPGYPTTNYIKDHPIPYNNPNLTMWGQAGYQWPKNELMHGCDD